MSSRSIPEFRHFTIEALSDGVWAAIHRDGGWAVGNAGIVDLGEATLLYDTFMTAEAARDLRAACLQLTGRDPAYVVDSHYHNDHIRGSSVFADAVVVASVRTRELIHTLGRRELEYDRVHAHERLDVAREMLDSDDPLERETADLLVPYWEGMIASLPEAGVRLPDLTFAEELTFHGAARTARLVGVGAAHTPDDTVLHIPEAGVLFASDVLFVGCHPYLPDGDPDGWLAALERLSEWPADRYVPGHGAVGTQADVDALAAYIRDLQDEARRRHAAGEAPDAMSPPEVPETHRSWTFAHPFYRANLQFLLRRLVEGGRPAEG